MISNANTSGKFAPQGSFRSSSLPLVSERKGVERAVAYIMVIASSVPVGSSQFLRLALIVILPLIPVILSNWLRSRREWTLVLLVVVSAGSGLLLASWNSGAARSWDSWAATSETAQGLVLILATAGTAWACAILGPEKFLVVWSIGTALFSPWLGERFLDNPWKFGLALPVSLFVICMAAKVSSRTITFAFFVLMGLSAAFSFRSWLLVLGSALLIHLFVNTRREWPRRKDRARKTVLVALLVGGVVLGGNVMSDFALKGYLGQYAQTRTQQSIDVSGNPFFGSRAEWGGALALMQSEPFGLGVGVRPSSDDWSTAIESLTLSEGLKNQSNVADSFRNGRIEFHSTIWNFWSYFGLAGIALALAIFGYVLRATLSLQVDPSPKSGPPAAALAVLFVGAMWDILFSPNNSWTLAVAIAFSFQVLAGSAQTFDPKPSSPRWEPRE